MKTLVIHPQDPSTDFLIPVYKDRDWKVLNSPRISSKILKDSIKEADRIIILGHGNEWGMGAMNSKRTEFDRFLIDSNLVYLLRTKILIGIWCNADKFFRKYDLRGLYTGMIISEEDEANMFCLFPYTDKDIEESNSLFTESLKQGILEEDFKLSTILDIYDSESRNPIIDYNYQRIFENK